MQVGKHTAVVAQLDLGEAGTGTPQMCVRFKITEGECKDEEITWYGYLTEKTAKRTIESRHLPWPLRFYGTTHRPTPGIRV